MIAGVPAKVMREATDDDLLHIRDNAKAYADRLASARRVRRIEGCPPAPPARPAAVAIAAGRRAPRPRP